MIFVVVKIFKNEDIGVKEEVRVIEFCLNICIERRLFVYIMLFFVFILDVERGSIYDEFEL